MRSRMPPLVTSATGAPRRSSRALVATVVPWASRSGRSPARAERMASAGSSGVDRTLATLPSCATRSVNVPPVSTPTCILRTLTSGRRAGPSLLGLGRLHRQHVDQVVHAVTRVTLDPAEADVPPAPVLLDQRLPQVPVGDRLLGRIGPAPPQPALPPAVPEAVHDVGGVADDVQVAGGMGPHGLQHGVDLHALVGAVGLVPAGVGAVGLGPGPASRPGVPQARAIRVHDSRHRHTNLGHGCNVLFHQIRCHHGVMIIDGFVHQLPDTDPTETQEWLDSRFAIVDAHGTPRARFLMSKLIERARELQVGHPATVSTPYVNTIPPEQEPWFPGDDEMERRIRAYIRWDAAVMVIKANKHAEGIGGHLSTFASSAALYDVGFNWFFQGKEDGLAGDAVYIQGHAAPGIYARAFLEGRLTEHDLDQFRQEVGGGLSSYPHPRLMPQFWEYPTVSMGLGALNSIYHARYLRYLHNRRIDDTSGSRVWCFIGDGEVDEPETLGALTLPAREQLDNLIWVINCNLQRLDGPVRGNGKVIQELEAVFRGAGWNVIKVVWGSRWDELLAQDRDGVLLNKMNTTVDGEFQRYAVESGAYAREHFFGPDPRLRKMVEHLSDDEIRNLPRGGHDYRKLYAAYKAATEQHGAPTVILAKTIKGWTLGPDVEGRNATHQIKKMTVDQLRVLRERLYLQDVIPEDALAEDK